MEPAQQLHRPAWTSSSGSALAEMNMLRRFFDIVGLAVVCFRNTIFLLPDTGIFLGCHADNTEKMICLAG
jgi:uncharacterized membrane protein